MIILYTQSMKTKIQRWWDVPAALFLVGALFSASIRLQSTAWTEHLGLMSMLVLLGAVLGFAMGKSIFSGRFMFVMGLVFSAFFVTWQLGTLMSGQNWTERLNVLYARLYWSTADFLANKPVKDPILFISTMAILYWFASLLSTYRLIRHSNPWVPLLSLGGMILVIEYTMEMYRSTKITGVTYSFLYLVFCLLLMGRIYYLRSRREWEQRGGTVEMEVGYDLGRGVAVAAIAVVFLAWNTPRIINFFASDVPAGERVSRGFQQFRDRISKAANSLRSPDPLVVEGYGSNLFLGTGGNNNDAVVFTVKPESGEVGTRLYWPARSYDEYSNGQWISTISGTEKIGPGQPSVTYPSWTMRQNVQLTFHSNISLLKTLYFAGEPLSINRPADAVVSRTNDGLTDLNAIVLDPPLKGGEDYTILASIPRPTVLTMRNAGDSYPDFIKQRYLQLPDNFSPRITELARQIAGDEPTAYDKAMAVTQYLRRTITYTETVPEPPRNRDPLEWFLFDLRAGFCNYYASSEVVMLRSLGVPARLVVGYAQGTWDPTNGVYTVIGKESHAWPEVYFPGLGWVPFEPTVSQPQSSFPAGEPSDQSNPQRNLPVGEDAAQQGQIPGGENRANELLNRQNQASQAPIFFKVSPWMIALLVVLLIAGVAALIEWLRRKNNRDLPMPSWIEKVLDERGFATPGWLKLWSRRALRTPMENLFASVGFMLRVWGHQVDPALTPAEQIAILVNTVPGVNSPARVLLEEYQRAMYSQYPANVFRARGAVKEIQSVGYRNWVMRLIGFET
jgi:transglutaminase-like putative cysteine protease